MHVGRGTVNYARKETMFLENNFTINITKVSFSLGVSPVKLLLQSI